MKKIQVMLFTSLEDLNAFLATINMTDFVGVQVFQDTKTTFLLTYKKEFKD